MAEVAVIGAGSWGTALAGALAGMGHGVRLWAREEEVVASIREEGRNRLFLPDIVLPPPWAPPRTSRALARRNRAQRDAVARLPRPVRAMAPSSGRTWFS